MLLSNLLSNGVSYTIVAMNYVLRLFIIALIKRIGKDTESEQTQLITDGVFIVQYFNTGMLLLFCNANMSEQGFPFSMISFGSIADFNSTWFNDIGYSMCYAILYNVFWPILEFFIYYGLRTLKRVMDRGFKTCSDTVTKKTTL